MPFTTSVWGCIFAAILANAVAHIGLKGAEHWKLQRKKRRNLGQEKPPAQCLPPTGDQTAVADDTENSLSGIEFASESIGGVGVSPQNPGRNVYQKDLNKDDDPMLRKVDVNSFLYRHFDITPADLSNAVYGSFGAFTSASNVEATNISEKMLNIGFTFFLVIILASYTANLASNLITHDTFTPLIADMDDANTRGLKICAVSGTAAHSVISSSYSRIDLVSIKSARVADAMSAITDGRCVGAVIFKYEWDSRQNVKEANPYCNLVAVDYNIRPFSGAW
jgi:hypothetical protein